MASPKPKRKPKPKKPSAEDKAQAERFKQTARMLGADTTGVGFERALTAIIPARKTRKMAKK